MQIVLNQKPGCLSTGGQAFFVGEGGQPTFQLPFDIYDGENLEGNVDDKLAVLKKHV